MEEELENGISLMEGILQNWANENKGKYHIFFPRCAKENDKDVVLFPIFEENKNGTLNLKVWAKYSLENYSLEDYLEAKNKVILFDKKLINYKKKKFAQNVIALIEIFYTAQEFMELSEDSIEYIANQELLEEKIDEYKQKFKTILAEEELAIAYGVKKNEPVKTEKAKLPVTNIQPIESKKKEKEEKKTVKIPDLTIKKLQESISKIDHKNNSKEKYMLKLMEEVGELAKVVNEDVRMKDKEIKGFIGINNGHIEGIFVEEKYRNQGIGKELLSYCKNKYDKLTLEVYSKNTKAINFYEREQFKIIKEYVEATNNEAELLMEWKKD